VTKSIKTHTSAAEKKKVKRREGPTSAVCVSSLSSLFSLSLLSHKKVNTKHVESIKRTNRTDDDDDERVRDESGGEEEEEWRRALLRVQSGVRAV